MKNNVAQVHANQWSSRLLLGGLSLLLVTGASGAEDLSAPQPNPILEQADANHANLTSPARRIQRRDAVSPRPGPGDRPQTPPEQRSIDGSGNNTSDSEMNATHTQLRRLIASDYSDEISTLAGDRRPGPREISNTVLAQYGLLRNPKGASDYLWQWGQFLDHDIDLTDGVDPAEPADIPIPVGDSYFDPTGTGTVTLAFNRSIYDPATGIEVGNPRQQLNEITGWIDASNVYGSDATRASALRSNDGSGQLKTSAGNLLPFNTGGLPNAGGSSDALFLAGDVRANEQAALSVMHTLFMREHNRLAQRIAAEHPELGGEEIYQRARRIVAGEIQAITYKEFLPVLLGPNVLRPYAGYRPDTDARIMNEFSTAAYRLGHSLLSPELLRLNADGSIHPSGHLALRDAFFAPQRLTNEGGIEPLLRGLAAQVCQNIDVFVVDDVRNFLFGAPGDGGFDLAALNIQRGRDHGLASYNTARAAAGLPRINHFNEISRDTAVVARLAGVYGSVDDIDFWVGGLAEDHVPDALVGPLFFRILKRQFEALRDGDRFWYQRSLPPKELERVEQTRLADVIRRNTLIRGEIQDNVFIVTPSAPPTPKRK